MQVKRHITPRPPAAVNVLMRRIYGDSAYKRSTKARRLKLCRKVSR